jgi:hypothetical protein
MYVNPEMAPPCTRWRPMRPQTFTNISRLPSTPKPGYMPAHRKVKNITYMINSKYRHGKFMFICYLYKTIFSICGLKFSE